VHKGQKGGTGSKVKEGKKEGTRRERRGGERERFPYILEHSNRSNRSRVQRQIRFEIKTDANYWLK